MKPEAVKRIRGWSKNAVKFVFDNFGVDPDPWQRKVLDALPDPKIQRISMQACVGPGKTAVLAWCGWYFLSCLGDRGEHPKGIATSVTGDNLDDNLWPELSKWQQRSQFLTSGFTWTKTKIFANDHPETWFLKARTWPKRANEEDQGKTLSGLHSKFVLGLFDESGEIPPAVARAGEQALSNCSWGKLIQAGNPTSHTGMLYASATKFRHLWYLVRITSDPHDPDRSPRVDIEWAKEQIQTYGRDNPWIMSSILGEFPPTSINALLGPDEVEAALGKHLKVDQYEFTQKRLGVDVARFGDDRTVIFPRQGLASFKPVEMRGARSDAIAARVMAAKTKWGSEMEFVDGTGGYGSGVIDSLIQAGLGPIEVQFAGEAMDKRYANKRAEMWFDMAKWVRRGGALPNIPQLSRELTAPTYTFQKGKFLLEPKDQIKKRLKFSPDMADALALTFALPDLPRAILPTNARSQQRQQVKHDYDPFADSESETPR